MSGQLLPGRPGNLTSEQQAKLQEFWKATMTVCGVPLDDTAGTTEGIDGLAVDDDEDAEEEPDAKADGKATDAKEKKKRKRNIFGRKKKDKETPKEPKAAEKKAEEIPATGGADDKYGQTKEFHEALAKNKPEDMRTAFWNMAKADHPDGLLLRYLRARKWDIEKALVMMISTLHWRLHEIHVDDDIMHNGDAKALADTESADATTKKAGEDFLAQLRLGKSFLHGTDKEGRPMCVVRVRLHHGGEQSEASLERFTVYLIETARLMLSPPVDTAAIVFDMTGFSMANMDYAPLKFMIKCFEANYPESLGVVLVHKAPWVFQGIWKIIKGWLDPVVASKVHFTNSTSDLESYVAPSHIITELGGDESWTYAYPEPQPDENAKMRDSATLHTLLAERAQVASDFEAANREWFKAAPEDAAAVMAKRNALAAKLKAGYWELDPYVRARSMYDRVGLIGAKGTLSFYPGEEKPAAGAGPEVDVTPTTAKDESKGESKTQENGKDAPAQEPKTTPAHGVQDAGPAKPAPGQDPEPAASGAILEPGLNRSRSRTPSRGPEQTPSRSASRNGPVPAGHEENGVD